MNKPLRVLHLEDEPDFASLVSAILEKEGVSAETVLVTDFANFTAVLERDSFDVILADYMLPSCNGIQALQVARQKCPEVPFLLLSGAIGEHAAIDILRTGATDYVLKSRLERLVPAIRRAVQESAEHRQRMQAEAEVREGERQYRIIFDENPVPMCISDLETGAFLEVNQAAVRHYGYARDEFLSMTTKDICSQEEASRLSKYLAEVVGKRSEASVGHAGLWHHRRKDGTLIDVEVTWSIIRFQGRDALLTMANDLTELRRAAEALKISQASLAAAQRIARLGSWELELADLETMNCNKLRWSDETYRIFGVEPGREPVAGEFFFNSVHPEDRPRIQEVLQQAFRNHLPYEVEHRILLPDNQDRFVRERAEFVFDDNGKPVQLRGIVMDVTERQHLGERLAPAPETKDLRTTAAGPGTPLPRRRDGGRPRARAVAVAGKRPLKSGKAARPARRSTR
jgi:PAS domain S-box-containing protein